MSACQPKTTFRYIINQVLDFLRDEHQLNIHVETHYIQCCDVKVSVTQSWCYFSQGSNKVTDCILPLVQLFSLLVITAKDYHVLTAHHAGLTPPPQNTQILIRVFSRTQHMSKNKQSCGSKARTNKLSGLSAVTQSQTFLSLKHWFFNT